MDILDLICELPEEIKQVIYGYLIKEKVKTISFNAEFKKFVAARLRVYRLLGSLVDYRPGTEFEYMTDNGTRIPLKPSVLVYSVASEKLLERCCARFRRGREQQTIEIWREKDRRLKLGQFKEQK